MLVGPGIPESAPWVCYYGAAGQVGALDKVASTYRVIDIDADPALASFSDGQIKQLRAGGKNRVLSYLNVGACERFRDYWTRVPIGFVSCGANRHAQLGPYEGYSDETWMNPANADYRKLLVDYVAKRIAARGIDGFFLDNMELLEHSPTSANGPCDSDCRKGGFELLRSLRERYPQLLIVMNGVGQWRRTAKAEGVAFASLLDGIVHEEVYAPAYDAEAEKELLAWKALGLRSREGNPLWIGVEDFVGSCKETAKARDAMGRAAANGFSSYVTDASSGQKVLCYFGAAPRGQAGPTRPREAAKASNAR